MLKVELFLTCLKKNDVHRSATVRLKVMTENTLKNREVSQVFCSLLWFYRSVVGYVQTVK